MTRPTTAKLPLRLPLFTALLLAQTTAVLAQPIVAFTGKDSDPPDEFAFVALVDLPPGTELYVTNNDWDNVNGIFSASGEGTLLFTVTATIPRGLVTRVTETSTNTFEVANGSGTATFVAGSDWTPTSADPHYAFTATSAVSPLTNVDEISALLLTQLAAGPETDPTTGTNASPDAIVADFTATQPSGIDYTGNRIDATNASLADESNFTAGDGLITLNLASFFGLGVIFADDFESGSTGAWTSTTP